MPGAPRRTTAPPTIRPRRIHTSSSTLPIRQRNDPKSKFFNAHQPRPRTFTHRSTLLLVSQAIPRPQLPFLYTTSRRPNPKLSSAVRRFITTEQTARWKASLRWHLRFQAYAWPLIALGYLMYVGAHHAEWEHSHPTPREYSFWSRWHLRAGRHVEFDEDGKLYRVLTNWQWAGVSYKKVVKRLESEELDGANVISGETLVEGVGRTGFDVSMKSEPWRRGYYQALMGLGRVAENLDGMAKRKGGNEEMNVIFPESEAENAWEQPEMYYMKILTTNGFDNGQRVDAALAYADWCDFKGLTDTATNMYDWALDIAASGLPDGADGIVDVKTGVIQKGKEDMVTQNLMKVTTALAVHHAKKGEVKEALPIFLSVLRARKTLPAAPAYFDPNSDMNTDQPVESKLKSLLGGIRDIFFDGPYPPMPPSGDTRPFHTLKEACEEAGLMTYIGEILFATSETEREKGLSWTRDSVEAAEAVMWVMDETKEREGREKCRECLETGLTNWRVMVKRMQALSLGKKLEAEGSGGFLGTGWGKGPAIEKANAELEKWKHEEEQIDLRTQKTLPLLHPLTPVTGNLMTVAG